MIAIVHQDPAATGSGSPKPKDGAFLAILLLLITVAGCSEPTPVPTAPARVASPNAIAQAAAPTLVVAPTSGYAGAYVNVRGQAWSASTMVLVKLADAQGRSAVLAAVATDAAGQFNTGFVYPVAERWLRPGAQTIVAHTEDDQVEATAPFTVVPPAGVVAPVATLTATVAAPASSGGDTPTGTVTATPAATVTWTPTPATTATWTAIPAPDPYAVVEPFAGHANTLVTVSGGGFPPHTPVNVALVEMRKASEPGALDHVYATTTTDNAGNYRASLIIPATWPDGTLVAVGQQAILVATTDQRTWASVPFDYLGGAPPVTPTPIPTAAPVPVVEGPVPVNLANGFRITFLGVTEQTDGSSTWRYAVEELAGAKDLGNWVLELPACASIITAAPRPWEAVHPDPNAGLTGIKWETGAGFNRGEFTVTVRGPVTVGTVQVAAKGPDVAHGAIAGPRCP